LHFFLQFNIHAALHCTIHDNSFIPIPILKKPLNRVVLCLHGFSVLRAPSISSNYFLQRQNVASDDDSGMGKGRLERPAPRPARVTTVSWQSRLAPASGFGNGFKEFPADNAISFLRADDGISSRRIGAARGFAKY
jgi:hypothetical protein